MIEDLSHIHVRWWMTKIRQLISSQFTNDNLTQFTNDDASTILQDRTRPHLTKLKPLLGKITQEISQEHVRYWMNTRGSSGQLNCQWIWLEPPLNNRFFYKTWWNSSEDDSQGHCHYCAFLYKLVGNLIFSSSVFFSNHSWLLEIRAVENYIILLSNIKQRHALLGKSQRRSWVKIGDEDDECVERTSEKDS